MSFSADIARGSISRPYLPRSSMSHLRATKKLAVEHAKDRTNVKPAPRYGWRRSSTSQPANDATIPAASDGNGASCGRSRARPGYLMYFRCRSVVRCRRIAGTSSRCTSSSVDSRRDALTVRGPARRHRHLPLGGRVYFIEGRSADGCSAWFGSLVGFRRLGSFALREFQ